MRSDSRNKETKHGIHLEPCYKKFAITLSQKGAPNPPPPPPPRRQDYLQTMVLKMCTLRNAIFAKKYRITRQQKIYLPITVCIEQAVIPLNKLQKPVKIKPYSLKLRI